MTRRYAIYFAPAEGSALDRFGAHWLGRDARTGAVLPQPALPGFTADDLRRITAAPRLYGFHATLKAPFALSATTTEPVLDRALATFAAARPAFVAPPLALTTIDSFLALAPSAPAPELHALAEACVRDFDTFRALPSPADLARRRRLSLSPKEEAYLARWGYPHIFDLYRFHLTLTGSLAAPERERVFAALEPLVAPFAREGLAVDGIALFAQNEAEPFRLIARYKLARRGL